MKIKLVFIIFVILCCSIGCTVEPETTKPTITPYLSKHTTPPPPTPEPVYIRPQNPIIIDTYLSYIQYQPEEGIELHFSKEHSCSDNNLIYSKIVNGEKLYGYMDMEFNILSKPISTSPGYFVNGLARITDSEGVKIIDKSFNVLDVNHELPFFYNGHWVEVCILSDGRSHVMGVDENNKTILELDDYYYGLDFDEYKDVNSETCLVPCYKKTSGTGNDLLWGYKYLAEVQNPDSEFILEPVYCDAGKFREGLAAVKKDEKWGFINEYGEVVIDFLYDHITEFNGGIACAAVYNPSQEGNVRQPNYWGVINRKGEVLVDFRYSFCGGIINGIAWFETHSDGDYFYNLKGEDIVGQFLQAESGFNDGFVSVRLKSGPNIINTDGETILNGEYTNIRNLKDDMAVVEINRRKGIINFKEEFIILPEYFSIGAFDHGYAFASKKMNDYFFVDMAGTESLKGFNFVNCSKFNNDGYLLAFTGEENKTFYIIYINDGE